jgi:hypothetical protein
MTFRVQRKRIKTKGSLSLGSATRGFPAILETTGSLKTRTSYETLKQVKLLFRSFFSANILLPTIDGDARLCEMANTENTSS